MRIELTLDRPRVVVVRPLTSTLKLLDVPNDKRDDHGDESERRKSNPDCRFETFAQLHRKPVRK